jgi:hypothetical protein
VPQADIPTVRDPWTPRSEAWRSGSPSRHHGRPKRPLIIGACPRSGTTLLRSIVNNHPELAMPAETDFVIPLWRNRADFGDLRKPENRRRVGEWIFLAEGRGGKRIRAKGLRDRQPTAEEAIERLVAAPPTMGSLCAACFELYADSHGKQRWGDKRPAYAGHISTVFQMFPDAQFVNVVRDPRGAVASLMRLGWHRQREALAAAIATWEFSIRRVDDHAAGLRPDQLLDVRYEDLLREPERVIAEVCEFAGLQSGELVSQMLSAERGGTFRPGWHENLSRPIDASLATTWMQSLTAGQIDVVEQATAELMERFGYTRVGRPRPIPPAQAERLAAQRVRRERRWREEDRAERRRRLWRGRRPVGAIGS